MKPSSLLVYGDASVDISLRIAGLPTAGTDTTAHHPLVTAGGSAANCAATVARLGIEVDLAARVGNDLFSQIITDDLLTHGVGISGLETTQGPSALVVALIDPRGQRTFVSARGPAAGRLPADCYLPLLDRASLVHVSGYSFQEEGSRATALHLLEEARRRGIPTSLDSSPLFADHFDPESGRLEGIDYLFPNAHEASSLTGASSPEEAALVLMGLGVRTVVITMGADGCLLRDENGVVRFPAIAQWPVVDTTGAGDGFAGGFLAVTLSGGSPRQACRVGNLVAAHVIAQPGGHTGSPSAHDLRRLADRWGDPRLLEAVQTPAVPARVGPGRGHPG